MEEDEIRQIAYDKKMVNGELFVKFIQKRFPNEMCGHYVSEWADRFLSGDPTVYMDDESLKIYIELIER